MAYRRRKNTTINLGIDGSLRPVTSEIWTPKKQNLFNQAYNYAKSYNYKYINYVNGNIYVRKNDGVLPTRIDSEADLTKLKEVDFLDGSLLPFEGDFVNQVKEILARVRLTQREVDKIQCLRDDLTHALGYIWPVVQVHLFGSIVTGLGIKTSDVDCYIQAPFDYPAQNPITRARTQLRKDKSKFTQTFAVTRARVPILKFVHVPTGFKCDINFSNFSGVRNSKLIAFLLRLDKRALPLAIILKYWSKVYNLTGTNLMPNYAFTLMVVFYLQVESVLPSVAELQRHTQCQWVNVWNTSFDDSFTSVRYNALSFYELLGGFFEFYKSFDFAHFVISPYLGHPVKKQQLRDLYNLPSVYSMYQRNVLRQQCALIRTDTAVCIQDPFDHSRNCTVALSSELFKRIQGHIAIVLRKFNERTRDDFLKGMFTHKLVYEPVDSVVHRESGLNFRNKYTHLYREFAQPNYLSNAQYTPSGASVRMHNTPPAGYPYNGRSILHAERFQRISPRLVTPESNENNEKVILILLGIFWWFYFWWLQSYK